MSYFTSVWVTGKTPLLVETDNNKIHENHVPDILCDYRIVAEVEGDYVDAGDLLPKLRVENNRLIGVTFLNQEIEYFNPPTDEELQAIKLKQFEQAVQRHLDTTARAKGYDDINSIAKYLVDGNQFYAECYAISIWCAEVWAYCYTQIDIFTGTIEEFILSLPKFEG